MLSTRRGSLLLAAAAALLAGILLFVFVDSRDDNGGSGSAQRVLVAKSLIPKGSSGDVVAATQLVVPTAFKGDQVKDGAISDPKSLQGDVATADIYPGQQITTGDFTSSDEGVTAKLIARQRAVAVPVDQAHGLVGDIKTGDRVDVLAGFTTSATNGTNRAVVKTLLQNVLVLNAPESSGGNISGDNANITLRVSDRDAANLAFTADNGKVWVVLRPPAGARDSRPSTVTLQTLLAGTRPIDRGN
jgi:Flp pilus assembly protein CpaB